MKKQRISLDIIALWILALCTMISLHSCGERKTTVSPLLLHADSIMESRPDSALKLLQRFNTKRKKKSDKAFHALLLSQALYKNFIEQKDDSLIQIAIRYYKKTDNNLLLGKAYYYQGGIYLEKNNPQTASHCYLKALECLEKAPADSILLTKVYTHLGICYGEQDLNQEAIEMYTEAVKAAKNDTIRIANTLKNLGDMYLQTIQFDSAEYYYLEALQQGNYNDSHQIALIHKALAGLYEEQERYQEANTYLSLALPNLKRPEEIFSSYSIKGEIMEYLNQNDSAIYYWKKSVMSPYIYTRTASYNHLYEINKKLKNWEDATLYADSFICYFDSIQSSYTRAELDSLMDNYKMNQQKNKLQIKYQKNIALITIGFILLLAIIISSQLWNDRRKQKKYIDLQHLLKQNRVENMLLHEQQTENNTSHELSYQEIQNLLFEQFNICKAIFKSTTAHKMLKELHQASLKEQLTIIAKYRPTILKEVRETFLDIMKDLKEQTPTLTSDELIFCIFFLLGCSKELTADLMNTSSDAVKTRKSRIKSKMNPELFNWIFKQ